MKFSMIFEGVDKASKVMAAEKKMAAATKGNSTKALRANQKTQRSVNRVSQAMTSMKKSSTAAWDATTRGARKANAGLKTYLANLKKAGKAGFGDIKKGAGRVAKGAAVASGILVSVYGSAALAAGSMTDVASAFERYETILISSTGSQEKAREAMGWVTDFAATTPFQLDQVTEGFVALKNYGIDPTNGTLRTLGDTSAAMGKPMMQAVEAMADAVTGENERLKEFGITASKTGDKITYAYTNAAGESMKATVKAGDRAAIQMKLMEIFNEKYGGSMERLSATWAGMISNIADMWMKFQLAIMNAGLFDWMKGKLKLVLDTINQMEADGSLEAWAKSISKSIQSALESAWAFGVRAWDIFKTLSGYLKSASDYVGGWENLAIVLGAIAFGPTLISTAVGIMQIANGLRVMIMAVSGMSVLSSIGPAIMGVATAIKALGLALLSNPVAWAVAGIAAGGYLIYRNWDAIEPYFIALWNGIKSAFPTAWEFIKAGFKWTPLGVIISNWDGISKALANPIETGRELVSQAWEKVKSIFNDWVPDFGNWTLPELDTDLLTNTWESVKATLMGWMPEFGDWSFPTMDTSVITKPWDMIKALFEWSALEAIERKFGPIGEKISGFISGAAWNKLTSIFSSDEEDVVKMAISQPQSIDKAVAATEKLKTSLGAIDTVMDQLNSKMSNMSWHNHGIGLMNTLAAGIRAGKNTVIGAVNEVAQAMRDHLPSSPAKTGPLSDIHKLKFAETIAGSIHAGPMVKAMRAATAATLAVAGPVATSSPAGAAISKSAAVTAAPAQTSSGGINITYNPTLHLSGDAAKAKEDFRAELRKHSREIKKIVDEEVARLNRRSP